MPKKAATPLQAPALSLTRVARTLYGFLCVLAVTMIVFDAGNLIEREAIIERWTAMFIVFIVNTIAWFIAVEGTKFSKSALVLLLTITLVGFAGVFTYWERGMASTSTILYALPLLVVATLRNRHALQATAALSIATYAFSAVSYFNEKFNEGYRIQLWGSIVLYSGIIAVIAWLIMILAGLRKDSE